MSLFSMAVAQEETVTLDLKQVTLDELFGEIRRQTGIRFLCNAEQVKEMGLVDVSAKDRSVKEVLNDLFNGTLFNFSFDRDVVTVTRKSLSDFNQQKSKTVHGWVKNEQKQSMPGVTVKLVGVSLGTAAAIQSFHKIPIETGGIPAVPRWPAAARPGPAAAEGPLYPPPPPLGFVHTAGQTGGSRRGADRWQRWDTHRYRSAEAVLL